MHILLVEDHPGFAAALKAALADHVVSLAPSATDAKRCLS